MDDPVRRTRQTYDEVARVYAAASSAPFGGLIDLVASFAARVGPRAVVADVGCGPARDTTLLRQAGLTAWGLDLSIGMLRARAVDGLVQATMRALPLRDGSLDGIWSNAAVLHVPRPEVPLALAEFARVIRPGGILHLSVAEGDGEGWESGAYGSGSARWYTYHREAPLRYLLATAGWTVEWVGRRTTRRHWITVRAQRA